MNKRLSLDDFKASVSVENNNEAGLDNLVGGTMDLCHIKMEPIPTPCDNLYITSPRPILE